MSSEDDDATSKVYLDSPEFQVELETRPEPPEMVEPYVPGLATTNRIADALEWVVGEAGMEVARKVFFGSFGISLPPDDVTVEQVEDSSVINLQYTFNDMAFDTKDLHSPSQTVHDKLQFIQGLRKHVLALGNQYGEVIEGVVTRGLFSDSVFLRRIDSVTRSFEELESKFGVSSSTLCTHFWQEDFLQGPKDVDDVEDGVLDYESILSSYSSLVKGLLDNGDTKICDRLENVVLSKIASFNPTMLVGFDNQWRLLRRQQWINYLDEIDLILQMITAIVSEA